MDNNLVMIQSKYENCTNRYSSREDKGMLLRLNAATQILALFAASSQPPTLARQPPLSVTHWYGHHLQASIELLSALNKPTTVVQLI